jgi:DNA-binding CsgD family transcriptional regulator
MVIIREETPSTTVEVSNLDSLERFKVVGDFQIDNHSYLIINLGNRLKTLIKSDSSSSRFPLLGSEITRLEIDGQLLIIVEDENSPEATPSLIEILTDRELQIATLVALGHCNKQIASRLCISEWTVSTHLRRIFAKLGVDSRASMVYRCASLIHQLKKGYI